MREAYSKNPILGYLNINCLRNKIESSRDAVAKVHIDTLCINETKLNDCFPVSQFLIKLTTVSTFSQGQKLKRSGKRARANFKKVKNKNIPLLDLILTSSPNCF